MISNEVAESARRYAYHLALHYVRNSDVAEDIAQDAITNMILFDADITYPKAYLTKAVHGGSIGYFRRVRMENNLVLMDWHGGGQFPWESFNQMAIDPGKQVMWEERDVLGDVIGKLTETQKNIIEFYAEHRGSLEQTAKEFGVSKSTIFLKIERIRKIAGSFTTYIENRKKHCKEGHFLGNGNVYIRDNGRKECIICRAKRRKNDYQVKKNESNRESMDRCSQDQ